MTCCAERKDYCVRAGATFNPIVRWGSNVLSAAAITAIAQTTPVQITAPGHGVPNGWPVAVVGVTGMNGINSSRYPPGLDDLHDATVVNANTLVLNDVSAALLVPPYVPAGAGISGGYVVWNTPHVLTGVIATMTVWDDPNRDDTPLVVLSNALGGSGMTIDTVNMLILPFLQTAGLAWGTPGTIAYYDLDVTDASGNVTNLYTGTLTIQ